MYFRDAGQVVWYYKQAICLWLKNYFGKTDIARESIAARIWQAWTALSVLSHEKQVVVFLLVYLFSQIHAHGWTCCGWELARYSPMLIKLCKIAEPDA